MKRSPMPPRKVPMRRTGAIERDAPMPRVKRLSPVSKKREIVNAERRILVARQIVGARCVYPDCTSMLCHPHEIWTRARSGQSPHALTCPDNVIPLCAEHHALVTVDTKLGERLGLVRASHMGCPCGFKGRAG